MILSSFKDSEIKNSYLHKENSCIHCILGKETANKYILGCSEIPVGVCYLWTHLGTLIFIQNGHFIIGNDKNKLKDEK